MPGAVQSLRIAVDLYGKDHLELVESHLLLSETYIGTLV